MSIHNGSRWSGPKHYMYVNVMNMHLTSILVFIIILSGNISSIIVLSTQEMQSNFSHLLIGLASFDLVYLLMSTLIFALPKLSRSYSMTVLPYIMPTG